MCYILQLVLHMQDQHTVPSPYHPLFTTWLFVLLHVLLRFLQIRSVILYWSVATSLGIAMMLHVFLTVLPVPSSMPA